MTDVRNIATGSVMAGVVVAGRMHYLVANRFGEPIYIGDNGIAAKAITDDPEYARPASLRGARSFDDMFPRSDQPHPIGATTPGAGDGAVEPAAVRVGPRRPAPVPFDRVAVATWSVIVAASVAWVACIAITADAIWQAVAG